MGKINKIKIKTADIVDLENLKVAYSNRSNKNIFLTINEYLEDNFNLTINNTIIDLAKANEWEKEYMKEYQDIKNTAPFWDIALTKWIDKIEDILKTYSKQSISSDEIDNPFNLYYSLVYMVYLDLSAGLNNTLAYYGNLLVYTYDNNIIGRHYDINPLQFKAIIEGVRYAYKLPLLKNELSNLENIANKAIEKGYIPQPITQPTPPPKEIKHIKWLKKSVLLAYLINELKTYGFIDEDNIWAICEQIFVDKKGMPIKATTFSSMVKNYEANKTSDGKKGKPQNHTEITELIKILKAISKEIE